MRGRGPPHLRRRARWSTSSPRGTASHTVDDEGHPLRAEIHHPPWQLREAEAKIWENTMAPVGLELPDEAPLLHYSEVQDVLTWRRQRA